jgi:hypothetical protein
MPKTCKISQLRVGQRFSFIPSAWHGPCKLLEKTSRGKGQALNTDYSLRQVENFDLKYRSNVVNPPGGDYGVPGDLRVRLLSPKPQRSRKGHHAGFIV